MSQHIFKSLMVGTALTIPAFVGLPAHAQQDACPTLEALVDEAQLAGLASASDDYGSIIDAGDPAQCDVALTDLQSEYQAWRDRTANTTETERTTETDQTEVRTQETETTSVTEQAESEFSVQETIAIEGDVLVEQDPPSVDVESGRTTVDVVDDAPEVSITQRQAEVVIRQAPPQIELEMPQPTITIRQSAPEIVITMPKPGVDVSDAQPQVEVRQEDPNVSVSQNRPSVDVELSRAENPEESRGIRVVDSATGQNLDQSPQSAEIADASVEIASSEPQVNVEDGGEANVSINRADQPAVTFEQAQPQVTVTGKPTIDYQMEGEPKVTFRQASDDPADEQQQQQQMAKADTQERDPAAAEAEMTEAANASTERDSAETENDAAQSMTLANAEDLKGVVVYDANQNDIGEVDEVLLSDGGQLEGVVVNVGGFLGLGEHSVLLDTNKMSVEQESETGLMRVYVTETRETLEQMPEYEG